MRFVDPPSLGSPRRGQPGDGLDRLLSDFFRSEMPQPWPEPTLPEQQPTLTMHPRPVPGRWSLRIENIIVVEEGGGRSLNSYPAALTVN